MPATFHPIRRPRPRLAAFSVIELLVAVSILSIIVFALYQVFNQTQRALRGNITQVDVMESGRAALDMITRELEQSASSGLWGGTNLHVGLISSLPVLQTDLDDTTVLRTNVLQEFFFLSRHTNRWFGTGYRVFPDEAGVGTLYRFQVSTNLHKLNAASLTEAYFREPLTNRVTGRVSTNFHRVADGLIHMRLTAYDPWGERMGFETTNSHPAYRIWRQNIRQQLSPLSSATNVNVVLRQDFAALTRLLFLSNALPSYVELEFGVLEPQTFLQYQAIAEGSATAARDFLKKRASKVHLFRQRIPIRTSLQ